MPVNAPDNVTLPAVPASRVRLLPAVAIVELNKMFTSLLPVVSMSTFPPSDTARVNETLSFEVRISPDVVNVPDLTAPKLTAPPALISPAAAIVVVPSPSIAIVPDAELFVLIAALIAIVPPESMSTAPSAVNAPFNVTEVVASEIVNESTVNTW